MVEMIQAVVRCQNRPHDVVVDRHGARREHLFGIALIAVTGKRHLISRIVGTIACVEFVGPSLGRVPADVTRTDRDISDRPWSGTAPIDRSGG